MPCKPSNTIATAALLALGVAAACCPARAQQVSREFQYLQYARSHVQFAIHGGRITVVALRTNSFTPPPADRPGRKEQVGFYYDPADGSARFHYQLTSTDQNWSVLAQTDGRVVAERSPGERGEGPPSEFVQNPAGPFVLTIGKGDAKKIYTAPTIWHLLLARREACRQYVVPLLQVLRPDWRLLEQTDSLEAELLREAKLGAMPDRRRWDEWVAQLADDRYARREAADAQLRAAGQAVVPYLTSLRREKLDAEQQYRIHRIVQSLTGRQVDESPAEVAGAMLADPSVWMILLERNSPTQRELAAAHLARLLGRPIDFNPAADPATRARQVEALRAVVGRGQ